MRSHGEGTLSFHRGKKLWVAKVSLPDGSRMERSSRDETIARGHLRDMLRLVGRGVTPKPRLTVAAFLDGWLTDNRPPVIRPQTWERYESIVRVHLVPGIGSLPLQAIRPAIVNSLLASKSGRTAQLCREVLRNALNDAMRERIVEYNAAGLAKPPRHESRAAAILTPEQLGTLLEGTAEDRLHALFVLAALTGMREGELLGLAWDDIDWQAATISVRSNLVRLCGEWALGEPKTRKGRRTIPIAKLALTALRVHQRRMMAERGPDEQFWRLVFLSDRRQPLYGYRVVAMMRGHLARLGIETPTPLRLHELRHSFASHRKAEGISDQVLADYLGHSTTRLLERYAHALPGADRAMVDRLG